MALTTFRDRWPQVLEAGEAFHAVLVDQPRPAFLDRRTHPWSIGDRAAWGELTPPDADPGFAAILDRLYGFLRPLEIPSQVIHGDLPGNSLFADGMSPAVIDFSPYHRPADFALAVVIVDAIAWYGASPALSTTPVTSKPSTSSSRGRPSTDS
jgi:Ser/Thr protein kinase RdoA (MazF antagonist)